MAGVRGVRIGTAWNSLSDTGTLGLACGRPVGSVTGPDAGIGWKFERGDGGGGDWVVGRSFSRPFFLIILRGVDALDLCGLVLVNSSGRRVVSRVNLPFSVEV